MGSLTRHKIVEAALSRSPEEPGPAGSSYAATDGAAYELFLGRWTQPLADAFLEFIDPPHAGALLDAGCGTGSLARAMAERRPGQKTCAIDIAPSYVAFAERRTPAVRVEYRTGDASALPYEPDVFAASAAQLVLNFVPDPQRAVREMMRVTQPGGTVAASVWDFRGGLVYQRLFWDTAAGIDATAGAARDRLFSGPLALPDGLTSLFAQCGLRQVERASLTIRMDYRSFDDYWQPMLGGQGPVGTYVTGLDTALRAAIERGVRAAYLSGAPDGPRSMTATAWATRGFVPTPAGE